VLLKPVVPSVIDAIDVACSCEWGLVLCPQVAANQLLLAPLVLAVVFSWNLALTGEAPRIPQKLRQDLVPSMINGGCWSEG